MSAALLALALSPATFAPLGERHTLILYDTRNRGRSSRVEDGDLLTIQKDVEDLERHFEHHFGAVQRLDVPKESVALSSAPRTR